MMSAIKVSAGAVASGYYKAEGYYAAGSEEGERATSWAGEEAADLGLDGPVDDAAFQKLLDGQAPNGQLLGRTRGGERDFTPGLDITLSAPKEMSIAALVLGDDRLIKAHDAAVAKAIAYVECNLLETRKQVNGEIIRVPAEGMIAGQFRHLTSRELDAQLHTHTVIANMVRAKGDNTYRAIETRRIFQYQKAVTQIYHAELYAQVKALGWEVERDRDGYTRLKGIPETLVQAHSTRSEQIKAALEARGMEITATNKKLAALATRSRKAGSIDFEELKAFWRDEAKELGLSDVKVAAFFAQDSGPRSAPVADRSGRGPLAASKQDADRAVRFAKDHLSERNATYGRAELLTLALKAARRAGPHEIDAALDRQLASGEMFQFVERGIEKLSDRETLTLERATISEWRKSERQGGVRLRSRVKAVLSGKDSAETHLRRQLSHTTLTEDQRGAVFAALTGKGRFVAIQGNAGTGKTFMMAKLRSYAEKAGYTVEGLAPSHKARTKLDEATPGAETVKHRLVLDAPRGKEGSKARTILVVDEASMISTRDMSQLMAYANRLGYARVVLVGDEKQLDAVEAGSPFAQLQRAGMRTTLMADIIRQREDTPEKASVLFALKGDVAAAMENILTIDETEAIGTKLAETWLAATPGKRSGLGVVVQTNTLRREVNTRIRDGLRAEGSIGATDVTIDGLRNLGLTRAEAGDVRSYRAGDRVIATKPMPKLGLRLMGEYDVAARNERREEITLSDRSTGRVLKIRLGQGSRAAAALQVFERQPRAFATGDLVRFRMTDKETGIINGAEGIIRQASGDGFLVKTGKEMHWIAADSMLARGMEHAYAQTAHGFQGDTVDRILIGMGATERLANQKQFYVSLSRMKDGAHLVTDDVAKLTARIQSNAGVETTALDAWMKDREARELAAREAAERAAAKSAEEIKPLEELKAAHAGAREDRARQAELSRARKDVVIEQVEKIRERTLELEKAIEKDRSIGPSF